LRVAEALRDLAGRRAPPRLPALGFRFFGGI
jgi:hypothetical protein